MRHVARTLVIMALAAGALPALVVPAAAEPAPPVHTPPVEAPVADPFRPPRAPYGPGNRGLEYDTAAGTPVQATGDGEVVFAGPVAGALHVTVLHPDGVRTSYSFLQRVDVRLGQAVAQGDVVGLSGEWLHLGARLDDAYFDPATLFAAGRVEVRLVPFDDPLPGGIFGERSALSQLVGGLGDLAGGAAGWLRDGAAGLARGDGPVAHVLGALSPISTFRTAHDWVDGLADAWNASHRPCTDLLELARHAAASSDPQRSPPRRVALLIGGLGSTSSDAAIDDVDIEALGYDPADVLRFSYAGGRTPDATDGLGDIPASAYGATDTTVDLRQSGARLADLIEQAVDRAGGATVDLLAHSQGGLVLRLALAELQRRHGPGWFEHLGLVATLGTPHDGADIGTATAAVRTTAVGRVATDALDGVLPLGFAVDGPSVAQLAETSPLIDELSRMPLPDGVEAVSIAARTDWVVPVPRTELSGAPQVVVDVAGLNAHDALPGSPEATRELVLAMAGLPPSCEGFGDALVDQMTGRLISSVEDSMGAVAWSVAAPGG